MQHLESAVLEHLADRIDSIAGHVVFIVGVAAVEVERRNAPGVGHFGIEPDVIFEPWQRLAHNRGPETRACVAVDLFLQFLAP